MTFDHTSVRLGAVHRESPSTVPHLAKLVRLPAAPVSKNWHAACDFNSDMLGNNTYGDCVEVFGLQVLRMLTSNIWGRGSWTPAPGQWQALYAANTTPPFDPAVPSTDVGTEVPRFMGYWASTGIRLGDQTTDISLWTTIDAANAPEAIAYTGPIGLTLALPAAAQDVANWAKAPGPSADWKPGSWGEHQVPVGRYDSDGSGKVLTCITWATEQQLHPEFVSKYALAFQAPLSRLLLGAAGVSPSSLNWDEAMAMQAKLAA